LDEKSLEKAWQDLLQVPITQNFDGPINIPHLERHLALLQVAISEQNEDKLTQLIRLIPTTIDQFLGRGPIGEDKALDFYAVLTALKLVTFKAINTSVAKPAIPIKYWQNLIAQFKETGKYFYGFTPPQKMILLHELNDLIFELHQEKSPYFSEFALILSEHIYLDPEIKSHELMASLAHLVSTFEPESKETKLAHLEASLLLSTSLVRDYAKLGDVGTKTEFQLRGKTLKYSPLEHFKNLSQHIHEFSKDLLALKLSGKEQDLAVVESFENRLVSSVLNVLSTLQTLKDESDKNFKVFSEAATAINQLVKDLSHQNRIKLVNTLGPIIFEKDNLSSFDELVESTIETSIESLPKEVRGAMLLRFYSFNHLNKKPEFEQSVLKLALNPQIFPLIKQTTEHQEQGLRKRALDYLAKQMASANWTEGLKTLFKAHQEIGFLPVDSVSNGESQEILEQADRQRNFLRGNFSQYFLHMGLGLAFLQEKVHPPETNTVAASKWVAKAYQLGLVSGAFVLEHFRQLKKRDFSSEQREIMTEQLQMGFILESLRLATQQKKVIKSSGERVEFTLPQNFETFDVWEKYDYLENEQPPISLSHLKNMNETLDNLGIKLKAYQTKFATWEADI
jgi:hypothetical protein